MQTRWLCEECSLARKIPRVAVLGDDKKEQTKNKLTPETPPKAATPPTAPCPRPDSQSRPPPRSRAPRRSSAGRGGRRTRAGCTA